MENISVTLCSFAFLMINRLIVMFNIALGSMDENLTFSLRRCLRLLKLILNGTGLKVKDLRVCISKYAVGDRPHR